MCYVITVLGMQSPKFTRKLFHNCFDIVQYKFKIFNYIIIKYFIYAFNAVPGAGIEPTRATHSGT